MKKYFTKIWPALCSGFFSNRVKLNSFKFIHKILKQVVCANGEHTRSHGEGKKGVMEKKKREVVVEREGGCVIREKAESVLKREGGRCHGGGRGKAVMNTWWKGKRAVVI